MKIIVLFYSLIFASLSWSAFAGEQHPINTKFSSMEEKCKTMGERHGLSEANMAAWMERCMTMAKLPKDDIDGKGMRTDNMGGTDGMNDNHASNDTQIPEDGDRDKGNNKD